jgi:hypothetical protein
MNNTFPPNSSSDIQQRLGFLYLAKEEFGEVIRYGGALLKKEWVIDGGEHASLEAKALDVALVVTYSRPFKRNYGFGDVKPMMQRAMNSYSSVQRELHDRIIEMRDREYAHADSDAHDVQVYFNELFTFSKQVTREPIQHFEIKMLIQMCQNLSTSIDEQIVEFRSALNKTNEGA